MEASIGAGPPPPAGFKMLTEKVSPLPSSNVSSVVCTVKDLAPASDWVKVRTPEMAVKSGPALAVPSEVAYSTVSSAVGMTPEGNSAML